jgi:hypothetical protein
LAVEESEADIVIWWRWDKEERCWKETAVSPSASFRVDAEACLISVGRGQQWALLSGPRATVNGLPCLPLEILPDRDEVSIAGEHYCFSEHAAATALAFAGDHRRIRCARCLGRLVDGDQIVRCPRCRAHYHATECWTYDARCQKCSCPTTHAAWVPDDLF